jgi:hypothetical protein
MKKNPAQSRFLGEDSDRIELPGRTIYLLTNIEIRSDEKKLPCRTRPADIRE